MKIDPAQRAKQHAVVAGHVDAIARWFARRRKTSVQKILLDLKMIPMTSPISYLESGRAQW